MRALFVVTTLVASLGVVAAPAQAAKKRVRALAPHAISQSDPYVVRDHDGEILGRDPDAFIRLMMIREGNIRNQSGR